jgi:hypothetical protein
MLINVDEKSSISFSSFMESQEKTRRDFNLFCQVRGTYKRENLN